MTELLDKGADANAREAEWQQTPLMFAAAGNRAEAITVLLKRGADPKATSKTIDVEQFQKLDREANAYQQRILDGMTDKGKIKPTASQQQAAIQAAREAFKSGKVPEPEKKDNSRNGFFNEQGASAVKSKGGMTALLHAARQGYLPAAKALIEGGADVNERNAGDGTSPLLMSVINGQFDLAMYLLDKGADPNIADSLNMATPLWAAVNVQWQPRTRLPAAAGNGDAEGHLPRRDGQAAREGRRPELAPQDAPLVHDLQRVRQPELRPRRHRGLHRVLARRLLDRRRGDAAAGQVRRRPDDPDDRAAAALPSG